MTGTVRRLVLVHGFTQTGASMRVLGRLLADRLHDDVEVVTPDAAGHGDRADHPLDLVAGASDLADRAGRGTWVGYSMGARLALHVAIHRPDVVERLVLIGGTPGIEDDAERAARRAADDQLADDIEHIGLDAFLDRWLDQPMFAALPPDAADRAARSRNTAAGLAASLRLAGTGTQAPVWDRLVEVRVPVLVMAGSLDAKFTAIGSRMAAALPEATFVPVEGAGHAAHAERPETTADAIAAWLDGDGQPPSASPSASNAP